MAGEMDAGSALAFYGMLGADDEGRLREAIESQCMDLHELYGALPMEHGTELPPEGGWIVVKDQPHTAIPSPPFASIWRARTVYYARSFLGLPLPGQRYSSRSRLKWPMIRARITTPAGELTLLPGEYMPVKEMEEWTRSMGDGVTLHLMNAGANAEGDLAERAFYLQAHGLRRWEALSMLLPEVEDPGFAWLSIDGVSDVEAYEQALEVHALAEPVAA